MAKEHGSPASADRIVAAASLPPDLSPVAQASPPTAGLRIEWQAGSPPHHRDARPTATMTTVSAICFNGRHKGLALLSLFPIPHNSLSNQKK